MPDDLDSAAYSARDLGSTVASIRGLLAIGAREDAIKRLHVELNQRFPDARAAIRLAVPELRVTRNSLVRLGSFVALTAHEATLKMVFALNREWFGVEVIGRKQMEVWPDADEVMAEIEWELTRAKDNREQAILQIVAPANSAMCGGSSSADISHSNDFRSVRWHGTEYVFTGMQAACVRVLWEAWERGSCVLGQESILEAAESACDRLRDVFQKGKHPAWNTMIQSPRKGVFCLAEPK